MYSAKGCAVDSPAHPCGSSCPGLMANGSDVCAKFQDILSMLMASKALTSHLTT